MFLWAHIQQEDRLPELGEQTDPYLGDLENPRIFYSDNWDGMNMKVDLKNVDGHKTCRLCVSPRGITK